MNFLRDRQTLYLFGGVLGVLVVATIVGQLIRLRVKNAVVDNLNRVLPKGEFAPVPMLASVSFGAPMRVGEGESKADFLDRARNAILELRQW